MIGYIKNPRMVRKSSSGKPVDLSVYLLSITALKETRSVSATRTIASNYFDTVLD